MGCTLDGKMLKKELVTIQRTKDVHPPFGTDKSVPYEHILTNSNFILNLNKTV